MTDNKIIDFKTKQKIPDPDTPPEVEIDYVKEALQTAMDRNYEDIIIIGMSATGTACLLTVELQEAIYEFTHAIYQLNKRLDE